MIEEPKPQPKRRLKAYELEQADIDAIDAIQRAHGLSTKTDAVRLAIRRTYAAIKTPKKPGRK